MTASMVRPASLDDLDALVELERLCFERPWGRAALADELQHADSVVWVAELEGAIAGHAVARLLGSDEAGRVGELLRLGVVPAARRRSVARALVAAVVEHLAQERGLELQLEVRADNEPALELYRALGFARVGRRRRYYPDAVDALLMSLHRAPRSS